jgi:hypothetical protein
MLNAGWEPWLNATPSIITVGDSLREGYYHHLGYTIEGMWAIRLDGATIAAGAAVLNLPQSYHNSGTLKVIGTFQFYDLSINKLYGGIVATNNTGSAATATMWMRDGLQLTSTQPATWADGDMIMVNVFYESSALATV